MIASSSCPRVSHEGDVYAVEPSPECWDRLGPLVPIVSSACVRSGLAFTVLWGTVLGLGCECGRSVGGVGSSVGHGLAHGFQLGEIHMDRGFVGAGWAEPCSPPHHRVPCSLSIQVQESGASPGPSFIHAPILCDSGGDQLSLVSPRSPSLIYSGSLAVAAAAGLRPH